MQDNHPVGASDLVATTLVTVRVLEVPLRVTPSVKAADLYEVLDRRKDEPSDWI